MYFVFSFHFYCFGLANGAQSTIRTGRVGITLPIPRPFYLCNEKKCLGVPALNECMADGPVCRAIPVLCQRVGRIYVVAGYKLRVFNACRQRVASTEDNRNWNKTDTFVVHKWEQLTMKYIIRILFLFGSGIDAWATFRMVSVFCSPRMGAHFSWDIYFMSIHKHKCHNIPYQTIPCHINPYCIQFVV